MTKALAATVELTIRAKATDAQDLSTPTNQLSLQLSDTLSTGYGSGQGNVLYSDRRTLAATSEDLDLYGALTDGLGATVNLSMVKTLAIHNRNTTAGHTLEVGGAASNPYLLAGSGTAVLTIQPDGWLILHQPSLVGDAVTAGTGDLLKIDAGANTVTYDIVLLGVETTTTTTTTTT